MRIPKLRRRQDKQAYRDAHKLRCEWCYQVADCGPHHVVTRGAGGPDVGCNLIQLCTRCHARAHHGEITQKQLIRLVAMREGMTPGQVVATVRQLQRGEASEY